MIKHTHYTGGGLKDTGLVDVAGFPIMAMPNASLPEYIDSRPFCLDTSPQGNNPYCAAVASAGFVEVQEWRESHIAKQIGFEPVYKRAKEIDGNQQDGTSLQSAAQALRDLHIYSWKKLEVLDTLEKVKYAILTNDVCIAGFKITDAWNHVDTEEGWIEENGSHELGGHAVLICGYDSRKKHIDFKNSWRDWGAGGFGRISEQLFSEQFMYAVTLRR